MLSTYHHQVPAGIEFEMRTGLSGIEINPQRADPRSLCTPSSIPAVLDNETMRTDNPPV
jgi:hypothetical protein